MDMKRPEEADPHRRNTSVMSLPEILDALPVHDRPTTPAPPPPEGDLDPLPDMPQMSLPNVE